MELKEYDNYLVNTLGVDEEVLNCITSINGYNEETLDSILYYYTGYRDIKQYLENEDKGTYREYYQEEEED